MVGSLTGGTSTCSDPTDDLFAMFSIQWNHYSTTNQQLKAWLDPDNTGVAEIPSLNPYSQTQSCDLFSNMIYGESYTLQHLGNVSGGYISGHNYQKITNYAEKFIQTKQTKITDIAIGVAKSISTGNANSLIHLQVFKEDTVSGLPGEKLMTMDIPINLLSQNKMNLITLDNPLIVNGKYFIGYELNYTNPSDTFAVYSTSRKKTSQNKAFIQQDGFWKPFYAFPGIDQPTSLLIDAQGCQSIAADTIPPTPTEANKFKILYPQTGISDYVYLQNTGSEEYVRINLYDISGRKMFIRQENITSVPQLIALENYSSGIYFLTIEGSTGTQVIKIRINRQQ
jgi:hypothetical protein